MKKSTVAGLALLYSVVPAAYSEVDFWEVTKVEVYDQTVDHTAPESATNWVLYASVETMDPGDATSIVLEGGTIAGSHVFDQDGNHWELLVQYPSKAAMDAELPGAANYRLILMGAGGSITQEFSFGQDHYPTVPFLTGADFSEAANLDVYEPLELNWNEPGNDVDVAFQINEGTLLDGEEVLYEDDFEDNLIQGWSWGQGPPNVLHTGAIEFVNSTNFFGNGFSADGQVSFNRLTQFPMLWTNQTVAGDDFNDNMVNTGKWQQLFADPGQYLSETNERLEWDSVPDSDGSVAWKWKAGNLSTTQDWAVAMDVNCLVDSASMTNRELWFGLALLADGGFDGVMTMEYLLNEYGAEVKTHVTTNETDVIEAEEDHDVEKLSLKLSYDSNAGVLSSAFSSGGDYVVQTNVSIDAFSSISFNDFTPAIYFGGEDIPVNPGQVFVDNFRIYEGADVSEKIERIEIEYLRAYGAPDTTNDNAHVYFVQVQGSHSISSVRVETPGGDVVDEFEWDFEDGGLAEWDFKSEDPMSEPEYGGLHGEWLVSVGLNDGTFVSTQVPFTQTNGAAIPPVDSVPLFTAPLDLHDAYVTTDSIDVTWNDPDTDSVLIGLDVSNEEDGEEEYLFYDALDDQAGLAPPTDGPLSTRSQSGVPLAEGENKLYLHNIWVRTDFNGDGIAYVVSKSAESEYLVTRADASDADGDMLPDDWEIQYFGSTNAPNGGTYENYDGDELDNIEEYIAGTDPTNSASVFAITSSTADPFSFTIQWPSVEGREYEVYWKSSLTNSSAESLGTIQWPQAEFTDWSKIYDEPQGFYLIEVRLAE